MSCEKNLPYDECIRMVSNIALMLSKNGLTQFIPFVTLHEHFSSHFDKNALLIAIDDFDFTLGASTGKHVLSVFMLNKIYLELKNAADVVRKEIQRNLKFYINTVDRDPPVTQKLSRKLLMMKTDIDPDCKSLFLSFNLQLKSFHDCLLANTNVSKSLFVAPLKYFEEYSVSKIFLELSYYLESIVLSLHFEERSYDYRNLVSELLLLKEIIIDGNINIIYEKFFSLIEQSYLFIEELKNSFRLTQLHSIEIENKIYIKCFLNQLVKLGEQVTEVKNLEPKLHLFSSEHNVRISTILDEEIHKLTNSMSMQNIANARLELRLNDDAYPLSVNYREFIKSLI